MATLAQLADQKTDLDEADLARLAEITGQWALLADLGLSDLVLWLPTWNDGGLVAAALVRPTTAPTAVPEDIVGTFVPRGRHPELDAALAFGRVQGTAYPVHFRDRVIAIVARHTSAQPRVAGQLEGIYLQTADDLFSMLVDGTFPEGIEAGTDSPRVGDGLIRLNADGTVAYASPNAVSALHRIGVTTAIVGNDLTHLVSRALHRPGPVDETLSRITSGRAAGDADVENGSSVVLLHGIPLRRSGEPVGALVLLRDATELRRRERALLSKDATIREIHHRVKNNLQTVAALLRLQARRAGSDETRAALGEAQLRVASIAVVHEALSHDSGDTVAFDEVVDRIIGLVRDLAPAFAGSGAVPAIARVGECGTLPSDRATPLAMCVSELLQNAVEHAHASAIAVHIEHRGHDLVVAIEDDGRGLPDDFDVEHAGLGLQIVESLSTGELRGTFALFRGESGGTRAEIRLSAGDGGE